MAASFLIALGIGLRVRDIVGGPAVARNQPATAAPTAVVPQEQQQLAAGPSASAPGAPTFGAGRPLGGGDPGAPGGSPQETIRLPAVARDRFDPNLLEKFPGAIPPIFCRRSSGPVMRSSSGGRRSVADARWPPARRADRAGRRRFCGPPGLMRFRRVGRRSESHQIVRQASN